MLFFVTFLLPLASSALDLISVPDAAFTPPASAGGDSYISIISADGRYVLFNSTANNLAHRANGAPYLLARPEKMNAFVRDRVQGTTTLISVDPTDTRTGEDDSTPTAISTNGQFVLFQSGSRTLVPNDPTSRTNSGEIYLRDIVNNTTTLVSVRLSALTISGCTESAMTPDARYVAFVSGDTNFVSGGTSNSLLSIFVKDLAAGQTRWASGGFSSLVSCFSPVISPDAKFVAFLAISLSGNPTQDVYICDLGATNTFCVSSNSHPFISGVPYCYGEEISQDGKYVVYQANPFFSATKSFVFRHNIQTGTDDVVSSNAVPGSPTQPVDMSPDGRFIAFIGKTNSSNGVFLWDGQTATTTFVSADTNGLAPANMFCETPAVDATGRFVSFLATANGLVTNSVGNSPHIYRRDVLAGVTELVDAGMDGNATNRSINSDFVMSVDGRFIAFDSPDTDLVAQDGNSASDVFVRDLGAETTELISASDASLMTQTSGPGDRRSRARVSADGHFAAFIAGGADLVPGYTNRFRGVFVRDLINQSNFVVTLGTNGLGNADGSATECAISGDGRYVAFTSLADNLVPNDTNHASDVFLRDLQTGATVLVSTNGSGSGSGNGVSSSPTISSDGRYVTFSSSATNIVPLPAGAPNPNLFEWDRTLGTKYALTANGNSSTAVTPDGRYVAFYGTLPGVGSANLYVWDSQLKQRIFTNTTAGAFLAPLAISTNGQWIAYISTGSSVSLKVVDRLTRTTTTVSSGPFGLHPSLRFSGDGQSLVYATIASNAPPDFNLTSDVYVFDMVSKTNMLVSRSFFTGNAPSGISDLPDISADGRYITYQSSASDIVPSDNNNSKDIFLFDRQSGSTVLLSASLYGPGTADFVSQSPAFTADGQTVAFQSWASDITANDFNQGSDLFLVKILSSSGSTNPPPVLTGQIIYSPGSGSGSRQTSPELTWAAAPGTGYQVQYKTNLTDDAWLPVNGSVVIEGGQGYVQDLAPDPDHRFYRIVGF